MKKNNLDLSKSILRGTLMIIAGIALLLHTLGIIETGINLILILVSVGLIIYGFMASGIEEVTKRFYTKHSKEISQVKNKVTDIVSKAKPKKKTKSKKKSTSTKKKKSTKK